METTSVIDGGAVKDASSVEVGGMPGCGGASKVCAHFNNPVPKVDVDVTAALAMMQKTTDVGPTPDATAADKPSKPTSPYRFIEGNRWMVQALLQYHYLPYWPSNAARVCAVIDIRTGQIVAGAVFAYPVLRCKLREQVFGELSPEILNRDFRQLVRLMVHPAHRNAHLATELLKRAFRSMDNPVVEAINRDWVPGATFEHVGMIMREGGGRRYYYRLKETRSRTDDYRKPPTQTDIPQGEVIHAYPRIWVQKVKMAGAEAIRIFQRYEGARIFIERTNGCQHVTTPLIGPFDDFMKSQGMVEVTCTDESWANLADTLPRLN